MERSASGPPAASVSSPSWDDLRVLLAVHRERSLLAAGRALGTSTSTVARRLDALEEALGRRLVRRSRDGTVLEPEGRALVAVAETMERGLAAARRDEGGALAGTIRISAGEGFARPVVHVLAAVRRRHPELSFEMPVESRVADIARREAEIGVRTVRTTSKSVVERKLATLALAFYAAPSYLESRLPAARLRAGDVESVDFIVEDLRASPVRKLLRDRGARRFALATTGESARIEAARLGIGVAVFADAQVRHEPGLVRLESELALPTVDAWVAYHQDLRADRRVAAVVRALLDAGRSL